MREDNVKKEKHYLNLLFLFLKTSIKLFSTITFPRNVLLLDDHF